jgi:hypothetical protein
MAAQATNTFELATPRRPTLDDVGGAVLIDDPVFPPDKTSMPYADQLNQLQKLAASFGRVCPVCVIWIRIVTGTPVVYSVQAASSAVSSGTFALTDETAGRVRIEWAANTFPSPLGEPEVSPTYTTDANNPALQGVSAQAEMITNGCRIRTYRGSTDGLIDYNFRVAIY